MCFLCSFSKSLSEHNCLLDEFGASRCCFHCSIRDPGFLEYSNHRSFGGGGVAGVPSHSTGGAYGPPDLSQELLKPIRLRQLPAKAWFPTAGTQAPSWNWEAPVGKFLPWLEAQTGLGSSRVERRTRLVEYFSSLEDYASHSLILADIGRCRVSGSSARPGLNPTQP